MTLFMRSAVVLAFMCALVTSVSGQLIIAHRGASHDAPENTMAAFRLAIEQGADGFEGDFYLTNDGHIICLHDKDTERVACKKLLVTETPFCELRRLDVGSWKGPQWRCERMPTLAEVLAAVPSGRKFYIELKSSTEVVGPMAKVIACSGVPLEQLVVISFHEEAVAEAKRRLPQVKAYWLTDFKKQDDGTFKPTVDEVIATLKRSGADAVSGKAVTEHFNEAFIKRLREAGYEEFHVWTVDDAEVARYYRDLGAASITTNRPGWLRQQLAEPETPAAASDPIPRPVQDSH
jgi:glycerophosphoryl diester phosphodiesterase